jgi:meso-butanediol dehydrogenase/(S,S)-butanediol dehydrogenase/diacetyl reductase
MLADGRNLPSGTNDAGGTKELESCTTSEIHEAINVSCSNPTLEISPRPRLNNKVAIITGATSGIGRATAIRFVEEGAHVIITGRRRELGVQIEAILNNGSSHRRCIYVQADHTKVEDCQKVVKVALEEFGGRIDVLFNNAGIVTSGTAETTTEEVWNSTFNINVTATWRMSQLVLPHIRRQSGGGVIVNNGSDWSIVAGKNALAYVMSKGAVGMMTKQMALDYARDGVRINAICPGDTFVDRWIERGDFSSRSDEVAIQSASEFIPMGRFGSPQEIANAVLFLASDESSYITGHLLVADGGHTAN